MAIFNVQRTIAPKAGNLELWFMCSAHCLMMHYIHVSFHENISNTVNLQSGHEDTVEIAIFNVQRAIIPDFGNQKLWFMCAVHIEIQSNFNGLNTFGTMTISSRQGLFEPLRVYYRARSGGIIGVSLRFSSS